MLTQSVTRLCCSVLQQCRGSARVQNFPVTSVKGVDILHLMGELLGNAVDFQVSQSVGILGFGLAEDDFALSVGRV